MRRMLPRPGRLLLWLMVGVGAGLALLRYARGLGAVTNLTDEFPWGLWVAFDILSGVALAAGGFTVAALVYVFHLERYHALVRPAIVTGFLGYLLVIIALLVDLGQPHRIWHAVIMWNPRSVMFEVAWCVMLYTLVLSLEFGQMVLERLGQTAMLRLTRMTLPPLVIAGVLLSTLHQSSLGALFLIVPGKLHPLWYTPILPVLFFISALAVGLAMVAVESSLSSRAFGRSLELQQLRGLGTGAAHALTLYLAVKGADLLVRGAWPLMFEATIEAAMFALEIGVGVVVPLVLLWHPQARRSPRAIGIAAGLVVLGVVVNRLNVAITGMLASSPVRYVPSWMEVQITLAIVAAGILAYLWIAEHLPVFSAEEHTTEATDQAKREIGPPGTIPVAGPAAE